MDTDSENKPEINGGVHEVLAPICSRENVRAILFYAGAFGIELFWGLIWQMIEPLTWDDLYPISDLMTTLLIMAPLGSFLFSIVFGILTLYQQA
jgi:hypothetical protein